MNEIDPTGEFGVLVPVVLIAGGVAAVAILNGRAGYEFLKQGEARNTRMIAELEGNQAEVLRQRATEQRHQVNGHFNAVAGAAIYDTVNVPRSVADAGIALPAAAASVMADPPQGNWLTKLTAVWSKFLENFKFSTATSTIDTLPKIELDSVSVPVVSPRDPNDKIGPSGIGPNRVVSTNDALEYMIRFENAASATAPVQELIVVDYLDQNLDWTTVKFEEIAYGNRVITPPANSQSFTARDVPLADSTAIAGSAAAYMVVDAVVSLNPQIGRLEWKVSAIDTNTGFFPQDALSGFLPQEDGTGRGQGYVRFSVKPRSSTPIGTGITNVASIVFDGNDAIKTPPVWNIIGDVPPLATTIAYLAGQIFAGTPFTYTVTFTNHGSAGVTNVVLTNSLPVGMTLVTNNTTLGSVSVTNGILTWDIGTLTNGGSAMLTVTVLPGSAGTFTNNFFYSGGSGLAIFTSPGIITVLPTAPKLRISLNEQGEVELFWSTNFSGFQIQRTALLGNSSQWTALTNSPVLIGDEYRVNAGLPIGAQFYRLSRAGPDEAPRPALNIQFDGTKVQLSWPANSPGYHLQSAPTLSPGSGWTDITNAATSLGARFRMDLPPLVTNCFYRLVKP